MSDPGMSDFSKRESDRLLDELRKIGVTHGVDHACEVAEAHVDAGARYFDGGAS